MKPFKHLAVSTAGGAVAYGLTGSAIPGIAFFLTGWLVDIDHFYEYIKENGFDFSVKRFTGYFYNSNSSQHGKKFYFFFHAHEIAIILVLLCFLSNLNLTLSFATLGYILHLLCDQFANKPLPFGYFLTYRVIKGFDKWFVLNTIQPRTNKTFVEPKME